MFHSTFDALELQLHQTVNVASAMRTTITLEDDAFATASAYARARAIKLGPAISELIRRGSTERLKFTQAGGVWVFELPADTPPMTSLQVQRMLDESA